MPFSVHDAADAPQIPAAGDHAQVARVELDEVEDFGGGDFHLDRVVDVDDRIGVPDGAAVVGHEERDPFRARLDPLHLAQFVLHTKNAL